MGSLARRDLRLTLRGLVLRPTWSAPAECGRFTALLGGPCVVRLKLHLGHFPAKSPVEKVINQIAGRRTTGYQGLRCEFVAAKCE